MEGLSLDAEAGASAASIDDLFERLEAAGRLVRIDPSRPGMMYRGTMLSTRELDAVRQIEDVVAGSAECEMHRGGPDRA